MTKELKIETRRWTLLDGVLFGTGDKADTVKSSGIAASRGSDTVLICITGIHGNFYSNPFYYNIGNTLTADGIDFIYAQTNGHLQCFQQVPLRFAEIVGSEVEDDTVGNEIERLVAPADTLVARLQ